MATAATDTTRTGPTLPTIAARVRRIEPRDGPDEPGIGTDAASARDCW